MSSLLSRKNTFNSTYSTNLNGEFEDVKPFASVQISALVTQNTTMTLYFSDEKTINIYTTEISLLANIEYFNSFTLTNRYFRIGLTISNSTNVKIDTKYLSSPITNNLNIVNINKLNKPSIQINTIDISGTISIPSNTYFIIIKAVGGGGGGGTKGISNDAGGGGGSGGYIELYLNESDFKTNSYTDISCNIGNGGVQAGTGGTTIISLYKSSLDTVIGTALGGSGGLDGNNYASGGVGGDFTINSPFIGWGKLGQPGRNGYDAGAGNTVPIAGNGGDSMLGIGGRCSINYSITDYGTAGTAGGGGGGGAYNSFTHWPGKVGGNGRIIIIFFKRN